MNRKNEKFSVCSSALNLPVAMETRKYTSCHLPLFEHSATTRCQGDSVCMCALVRVHHCVKQCLLCVCLWLVTSPLMFLLTLCLCRKFGERPQPQRLTR